MPSPGIELLKSVVKCPEEPSEYNTSLPVPRFEENDTWPTLSQKYMEWGVQEWKRRKGKVKWEADHPGCHG